MSTNPKDLNPKESSESMIRGSKCSVDASLRNLQKEMEQENTLVLETPVGRLQRVLKIYRGIKPLLSILSTLPLIPSTWRAAIVMFNQALESMAASAPDLSAEFKAGKDI
jgi:hypothetical protein